MMLFLSRLSNPVSRSWRTDLVRTQTFKESFYASFSWGTQRSVASSWSTGHWLSNGYWWAE